jgi:hypothetical protein
MSGIQHPRKGKVVVPITEDIAVHAAMVSAHLFPDHDELCERNDGPHWMGDWPCGCAERAARFDGDGEAQP